MLLLLMSVAVPTPAGYKVRPWNPRAVDSYPARLASEGVTIAADPLLTDELAAQVFDNRTIVSRAVMPLAVIIFNNNDYPVEVEAASIEVLTHGGRMPTVKPNEALHRMLTIYQAKPRDIGFPGGMPPKTPKLSAADTALLQDFQRKWLGFKKVEPHTTGGGFVYVPVMFGKGFKDLLAEGRVYIPKVFRPDTGASLLFFEIELKPAVNAVKESDQH
jgi:hypothetical protein